MQLDLLGKHMTQNNFTQANSTRPNVLVVLLDDYGWKDSSCYGSSFYETPNLDKLASQGTRFTNAYASCPVCSPTRASLLTGKYPARLGVTDWINHGNFHPCKGKLVDAPYIKQLDTREYSLAKCLKDNGYQTWHVGKWHLGQKEAWPDKHGFDVNVGGSEKGAPHKGYFSPYDFATLTNGPDGEYLTDRLTDEAITLIQKRDQQRPFFLNYWAYAVHTPIQAKADDIAYFQAKAKRLKLDQIDPIVKGEHFASNHKKHLRVERRIIQSNPVYAAMVKNMDDNLGRLMASLEQTGQADNTLVIFTSDNGGLATAESSPTCNAPLAEGKGWMYEGGTREPLVISMPGVIKAGVVCDDITTTPDIYPTILEAVGIALVPKQHCDGVSLFPILKELRDGEMAVCFDRGPIFWHYPHYGNQGGTPGCAVREGDYKLTEFFEDNRLELYDLKNDISEVHDLSKKLPKVTSDLHAKLVSWREAIEAKMPQQNPEYETWDRFATTPTKSPS